MKSKMSPQKNYKMQLHCSRKSTIYNKLQQMRSGQILIHFLTFARLAKWSIYEQ